ncbi:AlpA family phage regulatory protein [Methylotenera sp.]|uniref:helix-turn-helix transcriptional regulator n=1 Tax=Methylotenera sp. TaxID=2051956 RepID=UPI003454497E
MNEPVVISLQQLLQIIPFSKTKIYDLIKNNEFPAPRRIEGTRKSLWRRDEVNNWVLVHAK